MSCSAAYVVMRNEFMRGRAQLSHYDRSDFELLFALQTRATQKLLDLLPTVSVGTAKLVDREVLVSFLDRVWAANDVTAAIARVLR